VYKYFPNNIGGNNRAVPLGVPWPDSPSVHSYAYLSKKQHGAQTVDLFEQLLGQQVYLATGVPGPNGGPLQYADTQVVVHRKYVNKFKIVNHNRPTTFGNFASSNFSSAVDYTNYRSRYPTAPPSDLSVVNRTIGQ